MLLPGSRSDPTIGRGRSPMALVAIIVLAGLGAGFLARGSLRNFERVRIYWWAVALVGLGVQAIPVPERFGTPVGGGPVARLLRPVDRVRLGQPTAPGGAADPDRPAAERWP